MESKSVYIVQIIVIVNFAHCQILSFINKTDLTCLISKEYKNAAIHVFPPMPAFSEKSTEFDAWLINEWNKSLTNSVRSNINFPPVTDKRWEEFELLSSSDGYSLQYKQFPFSVCATEGFVINALNEDLSEEIFIKVATERKNGKHCHWFHYSLEKNSTTLYLSSKKERKNYNLNFEPYYIYIMNIVREEIYWKLHKYDFRATTLASQEDKSIIPVDFGDNNCLSMFVSVGQNCFLNITLEKGEISKSIIINESKSMNWRRIDLEWEYSSKANLTFFRGKNDLDFSNGFWAVDKIGLCSKNSEVYHFHFENEISEVHVCEALDKSSDFNSQMLPCEKPNFLGQDCDISCDTILGKNFQHYENHTICLDMSKCFCSWESQGIFCNERCEEGKWGPSCIYKCKSNCTKCHPMTGECEEYQQAKLPNVTDKDLLQIMNREINKNTPDLLTLQNFTIYCRNFSSLWVWYQEQNFKRWKHTSNFFPCELWDNFICTKIDNLKSNALYSLLVRLKPSGDSSWKQSKTIQGITKEEEPEAPLNLRSNWVLPNEISIEWDHPFITNGPVQKFLLNVTAKNVSKEYTIKVSKVQKSYEITFPVDYNVLYIISVRAYNQFEGKKVEIERKFYPTDDLKTERYWDSKLLKIEMVFLPLLTILLLLVLATVLLRLQRNRKTENDVLSKKSYQLLTKRNRKVSFDENSFKIHIRYLESYVKSLIHDSNKVREQFLISTPKPTVHALENKNYNKNRNQKNIPYDFNRVMLNPDSGDYINASYIDGFDKPQKYIATQGPKFNTVKDFWRMIWQEEVETIVMATNFIENEIRKCAEYFPEKCNAVFECGEIFITLSAIHKYEYYTMRHFKVQYKRAIREIQHFQLNWNPESVPYPNIFVPLVEKIHTIAGRSSSPVVIHCSSGVNRTGTLILCDLALDMVKTECCVDFYSLLKKLRNQRINMVVSEYLQKQYILAHFIVLECIMNEKNVCKNLETDKVIKEQFNYLQQLHWHDEFVQDWMPKFSRREKQFHSVDGYAQKNKFLTTNVPNDMFSFWQTIINKKIRVVVLLDSHKFWPQCFQHSNNIVTIKEVKSISTSYCTWMKLSLLVCQQHTNQTIFNCEIDCFQANLCISNEKSPHQFLNLLEVVSQNYQQSLPILVICQNGISKCGLFVTLDYILEKCKAEIDVDVCNGIRTVRRCSVTFIRNTNEMNFVYKVILEYQQKFDKYSSVL